jgi:hypothetical protein
MPSTTSFLSISYFPSSKLCSRLAIPLAFFLHPPLQNFRLAKMYLSWRYIVFILFTHRSVAADVPNTFELYPPYQQLRTCAQKVFGPSQIVSVIGCPSPVYNGCFCRGVSDFSVTITGFFSSFVNSICSSSQADLSSVFAVYDGYCSTNGFPHPAANNAVTTTLPGSIGDPTSTVLIITTATSTSSPGVNSAATRECYFSLDLLGLAVLLPLLLFDAFR